MKDSFISKDAGHFMELFCIKAPSVDLLGLLFIDCEGGHEYCPDGHFLVIPIVSLPFLVIQKGRVGFNLKKGSLEFCGEPKTCPAPK